MSMKLSEITKRLQSDREAFIAESDRAYRDMLGRVAQALRAFAKEKPIILLAGPSGSGKTTTAQVIEEFLDNSGVSTHSLSMDNYFHSLSEEERRLVAENKLDLESPARLDAAFLRQQLEDLYRGKTIELPRFDFSENRRQASGKTLTLKKGELIILEGIHALNSDLFGQIDAFTSRLFVSVETGIEMPDGSLIPPEVIRLGRRMVRDARTRNRTFPATAHKFDSVEQGARQYILPYKERADFDIDTFIPYEIGAYRGILCDSGEADRYPAWRDLVRLLEAVPEVDEGLIPAGSLVREFVGGGMYHE